MNCRACSGVVIRPECVDITVQRGTDNPFEAVITNGEGEAQDISNDAISLTVRESNARTLVFKKTNLAGSHSDGPGGKTEFIVDATDIDDETSPTAITHWVYEIRRILQTGKERIHIAGAFIVEPVVGS